MPNRKIADQCGAMLYQSMSRDATYDTSILYLIMINKQ
jgi:hypothetical protein